MRGFWQRTLLILIVFYLVSTVAWTAPKAYTIRFRTCPRPTSARLTRRKRRQFPPTGGCTKTAGNRYGLLCSSVRESVWISQDHPKIAICAWRAEESFFIWGREVSLDPQEYPVLELVWGVEKFPDGAAMDLYERNDRAIVVQVLFGDKLPTSGFPDLPRMLAYFGEKRRQLATTTPACRRGKDRPTPYHVHISACQVHRPAQRS